MLEIVALWAGISGFVMGLVALAQAFSAKENSDFAIRQVEDLHRALIRHRMEDRDDER